MPKRALFCLLAIALTAFAAAASAQGYPNRPVRVIIPAPPGGNLDPVTRMITSRLEESLKQPFVVESRAGASGIIGTQYVVTQKPDGYTLLFGYNGLIMAQYLFPVTYDLRKDLTAITEIAESPLVVAVPKSTPASDLKSFVEYARAAKEPLKWAVSGMSNIDAIATLELNARAGIKGLVVSFGGGGQAMNALLGGQVDAIISPTVTVRQHVAAGKLKAFAGTSRREMPTMPGIPSIASSGFPGYEFVTWFGIWGPKGMPADLARKIQEVARSALNEPQNRDKLTNMGFTAIGSSPEVFAAYVDSELKKFEVLIRERGIKAQ